MKQVEFLNFPVPKVKVKFEDCVIYTRDDKNLGPYVAFDIPEGKEYHVELFLRAMYIIYNLIKSDNNG